MEFSPIPVVTTNSLSLCGPPFSEHLSSGSVRLYLSALRFYQVKLCGVDPLLPSMTQLHYTLWGLSRLQPACSRPSHLPITMEVLETLFQSWSAGIPTYDHVMLWAACSLSFFAFLRAGEFTVVPGSPQVVLSSLDIRVDCQHNPTYLSVSLRGSKTDPFGEGCTFYIG